MPIAHLQALSGALFGLFLALHLTTTASAIAGPPAYDRVLAALRTVYRPNIVVEVALIAVPAVVHVVCAGILIRRRRQLGPLPRPPLRVRLHRSAGYVLVLAFGGHVFATRVMPALAEGLTATGRADYSFLAYSLVSWPGFMIPYYFLLGAAGAVHLGIGLATALRILLPASVVAPLGRPRGRLAAVALVAVVAGVIGLVARADRSDRSRFPEFTALYQRFVPFLMPRASEDDVQPPGR